MAEPEETTAEETSPEETSPEEIEVVAHSDDDEEELNAGCIINNSNVLE